MPGNDFRPLHPVLAFQHDAPCGGFTCSRALRVLTGLEPVASPGFTRGRTPNCATGRRRLHRFRLCRPVADPGGGWQSPSRFHLHFYQVGRGLLPSFTEHGSRIRLPFRGPAGLAPATGLVIRGPPRSLPASRQACRSRGPRRRPASVSRLSGCHGRSFRPRRPGFQPVRGTCRHGVRRSASGHCCRSRGAQVLHLHLVPVRVLCCFTPAPLPQVATPAARTT